MQFAINQKKGAILTTNYDVYIYTKYRPCWCPTMQLEVQFKRRPSSDEVLTSIASPHIINSRFDASGGVWDLDGNLIAITR